MNKTISFVGFKDNNALRLSYYIFSFFVFKRSLLTLSPIKTFKNRANVISIPDETKENDFYRLNERNLALLFSFQKYYTQKKSLIIRFLNLVYRTDKFQSFFLGDFAPQIRLLTFETNFIRQINPKVKFILPNTFFYRKYGKTLLKSDNVSYSRILAVIVQLISVGMLCIRCIQTLFILPKKRKRLKGLILREIVWGGNNTRTLRDDMFVDDEYVNQSDMVYFSIIKHGSRKKAYLESIDRPPMKFIDLTSSNSINFNKAYWSNLFYNFFLFPIYLLLTLFQLDLLQRIHLIIKDSQKVHKILSFSDVKWINSSIDYGDHIMTIVSNIFGVKTFLYHWSDISMDKECCSHQTICHNVIFSWGKVMKEFFWLINKANLIKEIGTMFKPLKNSTTIRKKNGFNNSSKIISFYDNSLLDYHYISKKMVLNFYKVIKFIDTQLNDNITILIKPKSPIPELPIMKDILNLEFSKRTTILEPNNYHVNEILALSDVNIGIGPNSTTTISLINNIPGIYFDESGNKKHPMSKYDGDIFIRDKETLLKSINKYLDFKGNIRNMFPEIENYDVVKNTNPINKVSKFLYNNQDTKIKDLIK